jgi:hypothetical protein
MFRKYRCSDEGDCRCGHDAEGAKALARQAPQRQPGQRKTYCGVRLHRDGRASTLQALDAEYPPAEQNDRADS